MWEVFALLVGAQTRRTEIFPVSEHTMRSDKECGPGVRGGYMETLGYRRPWWEKAECFRRARMSEVVWLSAAFAVPHLLHANAPWRWSYRRCPPITSYHLAPEASFRFPHER